MRENFSFFIRLLSYQRCFFIGELNRDEGPLTALISMLNASSKNQDKRRTLELDEAAFLKLLGANCQALDFHFAENTSQEYR